MTLIAAEIQSDGIRMWADSALSSNFDRRSGYEAIGLKLFILHPELCVAFAGRTEDATREILDLGVGPQTAFDIEEVLEQLQKAHEDSEGRVDFLIASAASTPSLTRISGGQVLACTQGLIGDDKVFSEYHQRRSDAIEKGVEDPMLNALQSISDEEAIQNVGGPCIGVVTSPRGFRYSGGWATLASTPIVEIPAGAPAGVPIMLPAPTTAQDGGFREVYGWAIEAGVCAFAVYLDPGKVGYLLHPRVGHYAIKIASPTQDEFIQHVADEYGIKLWFPQRLDPGTLGEQTFRLMRNAIPPPEA